MLTACDKKVGSTNFCLASSDCLGSSSAVSVGGEGVCASRSSDTHLINSDVGCEGVGEKTCRGCASYQHNRRVKRLPSSFPTQIAVSCGDCASLEASIATSATAGLHNTETSGLRVPLGSDSYCASSQTASGSSHALSTKPCYTSSSQRCGVHGCEVEDRCTLALRGDDHGENAVKQAEKKQDNEVYYDSDVVYGDTCVEDSAMAFSTECIVARERVVPSKGSTAARSQGTGYMWRSESKRQQTMVNGRRASYVRGSGSYSGKGKGVCAAISSFGSGVSAEGAGNGFIFKGPQSNGSHKSPLHPVYSGGASLQCTGAINSHMDPSYSQGQLQRRGACRGRGTSRRTPRRGWFGAAAVEAIRSRLSTINITFHQTTLSPSAMNHVAVKQCTGCREEQRAGFCAPPMRSKTVLGTPSGLVSPDTADQKCTADTARVEADPGATTSAWAEANNGAFRLSNIAPFYHCALQQLIKECERRSSIGASDTACSGFNSFNLPSCRRQSSLAAMLSTHSFDLPSTPSKTSTLSPLKISPVIPFTVQKCSRDTDLRSPQLPTKPDWATAVPTNLPSGRTDEPQYEEEETRTKRNLVGSGGVTRKQSIDMAEFGASSSAVQQLIVSLGAHIAYGDAAPLVLIGALVYLSRIALHCNSVCGGVTASNWYSFTTVAVLLATKMYLDDSRRWNERFSLASNIPVKELNKLEIDFLYILDFGLLIREDELEAQAEWMESVARRCDMVTPLRTFVLGRNSCSSSNVGTPMSSFCDDSCFRSCTQPPSGTAPSTPLSLTPSSMTPTVIQNGTPIPSILNRAVHYSSFQAACDGSGKKSSKSIQTNSNLPLSPTATWMSPNPFLSCPRSSDRLFSVVHMELEPATPPSLYQTGYGDNMGQLTPLDLGEMSPVGFFQRASCSIREDLSKAGNLSKSCADVLGTNRNGTFGASQGFSDGPLETKTPPHRPRYILSPLSAQSAPLPPWREPLVPPFQH
ncbi:putative CYC2-like cyclin [Trypanosoma vivax]|nr:putative CYC2-like cyclin [Trypanosoma vivax]